MLDLQFWKEKKVFVTGHTGFKGSWLCLWLDMLGTKVTGYALEPPTDPSIFQLCEIDKFMTSVHGDIRDYEKLLQSIQESGPEIVIHMAAQPLVLESYNDPLTTYTTNVIGTANLLESIRNCPSVKAVIIVTTDKCYENKEWVWGYRETDALGGYDPYSSSKACAEMVVNSYLRSFFNCKESNGQNVNLATVRAGNVIGGGDWAKNRIVPDCIQSLLKGSIITIRNSESIRPWQHVLEPLGGYLLLVEQLYKNGMDYNGSWNFGPDDRDVKPVKWIVNKLYEKWGRELSYIINSSDEHEANYLKLDCSKASMALGWNPTWDINEALDRIVEWFQAYQNNSSMLHVCKKQIEKFMLDFQGRNT